jgi:hypothetical protein
MRTHLLELHGTLDVTQLWPECTSDADAFRVRVARRAFHWLGHPLPELDDGRVFGRVEKPVVEDGVVHVRLEGVDAPELHYRPTPPPWLGLHELRRGSSCRGSIP